MNTQEINIQDKSLKALEWDKLQLCLAQECETKGGQVNSGRLKIENSEETIWALLSTTAEAKDLILKNQSPTLISLPWLDEVFNRLKIEGCLTLEEIRAIKVLLKLVWLMRSYLTNLQTDDYPHITGYLRQLYPFDAISKAIAATIDDDGQVRDDASPTISETRREINRLTKKIKNELAEIINSPILSKALQEPIATIRNDRHVLPVNSSLRSQISGIVHDTSASGLTVYIEPTVVVELSNQIKIQQIELEREIQRLLQELSNTIRLHRLEIESSYIALVDLDLTFAKARLAIKYDGTLPRLSKSGEMHLIQARHPLLALQTTANTNRSFKTIGNDIIFHSLPAQANGYTHGLQSHNQYCRTLIVTGPNTGGKTVLLKTVGLLAIMVKAGLLLPVQAGSSICLFDKVLADIGDEQSLEQSLSTFSSHLTNIQAIIDGATEHSLVLFDELGAGTDPQEGAALAQAILEHLHNRKILSLSTTHLIELKTLGHTQNGFLNASFDFDTENLAPTYKLKLGIPGSSQATNIAQKLGLEATIIERARTLLEYSKDSVQSTMAHLEERLKLIDQQEEALKIKEETLGQQQSALEAEQEALQKALDLSRNQYASTLKQEFDHALATIRALTASLQMETSSAELQKGRDQLLELQNQLAWLKQPAGNSPALGKGSLIDHLKIGSRVFVKSIGNYGIIEKLAKDFESKEDPDLEVRIGSLRLRVPLSHLGDAPAKSQGNKLIPTRKSKVNHVSRRHSQLPPPVKQITGGESNVDLFLRNDSNTLDLRGQRVEGAIAHLDQFINQAIMQQISPLMVIHGHGTGALKKAVREQLNTNTYNLNFRPGDNHEGADGVTIINLRYT